MPAPAEGGKEVEQAQEAGSGLIVPGGQAAKALEAVKKPLDSVALAITAAVDEPPIRPIFLAGNDDLGSRLFHWRGLAKPDTIWTWIGAVFRRVGLVVS